MAAVGVDRQSRAARALVVGPRPSSGFGAGHHRRRCTDLGGHYTRRVLPPHTPARRRATGLPRAAADLAGVLARRRTRHDLSALAARRSARRQSRRDRAGDRLSLARCVHHARRAARSFALLDAPGGVTVGGRHALAIAATGRDTRARRSGTLVEI